jgi:hypothetical protein
MSFRERQEPEAQFPGIPLLKLSDKSQALANRLTMSRVIAA